MFLFHTIFYLIVHRGHLLYNKYNQIVFRENFQNKMRYHFSLLLLVSHLNENQKYIPRNGMIKIVCPNFEIVETDSSCWNEDRPFSFSYRDPSAIHLTSTKWCHSSVIYSNWPMWWPQVSPRSSSVIESVKCWLINLFIWQVIGYCTTSVQWYSVYIIYLYVVFSARSQHE